ncbi:tail assembly protein [Escherichia coli]|uniref:tail assembly protein n=1 Tax=Escherichia coli TaxID=562 RepID=UPI001846F26C|nr:tail assembly protein [Escherichia coli]EFE6859301.1 tail assembly protein [Escherichia coli]EGB2408969.1 tail assembly protein [Escherichia coli]MCB4483578.1 tail assembly protein [Escherichia coli]CAK0703246.1 tail assembly protein [Escherichia coli]
MQEVMTRIELGGVLGKTFGKTHHRLISTVHEATKSLSATINGFEKFMISSKMRGLTYAVFRGKENINKDELSLPVTPDVIRIVPVIIGSKKAGILQTILGAVLVVAGVLVTGLSYGWAAPAGGALISSGIALSAGGVIQLLSPQAGGLASKQSADNRASYAFGGVTNTAAQGNPVPVGYGKRRIGGAVISAGIYVEDKQ